MDNEPEVIREQMAGTRASMADKLETLEEKVVGAVEGATTAVSETVANVKDAVQETVSTVKETVSETVEGVKEAFDLRRQVERHPCLMTAAALAVGYVAGSLTRPSKQRASRWRGGQRPLPPEGSDWGDGHLKTRPILPPHEGALPAARSPAEEPIATKPSWAGVLAPELAKFKGMAIGYLMGAVRDAMSEALPPGMRDQIHETMDSITHKLGGEPVRGPVLGGGAAKLASTSGRGAPRPESRSTRGSVTDVPRRW
jgi:hypothetical protein